MGGGDASCLLGLCSRTTRSPLSHWLQNVSSVPRQRASFAGGERGVAVWSVGGAEGGTDIPWRKWHNQNGGRERGEEGRKEALVSNRKRRRAVVAADWPNSQLNLQARRTARSQGVASVTSFKLQTLKVLGVALSQSN